ncbi:hypothetical protein N7492_007268 [Penicillium capsulatum]|uniref:Zn(2)-C6 fungal-type domain-containing protein n=1 Tax=Penicillium capsulatum TaxID=69766 RepID=A0A9W9I1P8_9EURO|nr:hypothetical protein N7492_007268 [Penicillium capsulatum]KAJ6117106.1 hypothetical protein N7512_006831 [Penicillium capsulatum]
MDSPRRSRNRAACQRCQRRKIRCDGSLPQCSACVKADVTCVNEGKQEVNRTYIANLQKKVQSLEALLKETNPTRLREHLGSDYQSSLHDGSQIDPVIPDHPEQLAPLSPTHHGLPTTAFGDTRGIAPTPLQNEQPPQAVTNSQTSHAPPKPAHEIGLVSLSGGGPRYIGPSSGYFLANLVFSSAGRRTGSSEDRSTRDPISLSAGLFNSPASLPDHKEDAIELSSKYFQSVHLIYPFLHELSHMQRVEAMYLSQASNPDPAVAFHVYMVLAIAASDLSRRFRVRLPAEGYYTTATQYFEGACAEGSLDGLQSLLLLMVYALHNPSCGVNLWSLNYQCLGSLIDLGLQRDVRASSAFPISFLEQEMRTRIFWVVYSFDRTLGTMMGRPIGVRDEACELRLPSDVADQYLAQSNVQERSIDTAPSHMTYSIHLFKLARMNSEIKYVMHSICRDSPAYAYPPVADIHQWQRDMIDRLKSWLAEIPKASGMDAIAKICETKYHELMILLLRPSPGIPEPSDDVFMQCFQHAVDLLRGFGELYRQEALLYSRLAVHSIFLGTLIMLHCLWKIPRIATQVQIDDVVSDTSISLNILSSIGEYWIEAKRARDCIHEISGVTVQRLIRGRRLDNSRSTRKGSAAAGGRRMQTRNDNIETVDQEMHQPGPAIDLSQINDMADFDLNLDTIGLFNDSLPSGFMDFAGAPDFDSLMWGVFKNI